MKILIEESVLRQALEALDSLYNKGMWAIEHVSAANYASRERGAYKDFTRTYDKNLTALRTALDAAEKVEPDMRVVRNTSGQIHMTDGEGNCFDMSKFVGQDFYTHPAPAVPEGWQPIEESPRKTQRRGDE